MYTQVAEKWLAQQAELTSVQKQFLEKALAFYQRLATEESADPAVLFETAKAEQRVGEIQNKLGKHAEAEAAYRRAIELFAQLAREAQDAAKYNQALAKTRRSLGSLLFLTGRPQEAEQEQRLAVTLCQALAAQFPDDSQYQLDLAKSHDGLGRDPERNWKVRPRRGRLFARAWPLFESLLTRSPDDHDLKYQLAISQVTPGPESWCRSKPCGGGEHLSQRRESRRGTGGGRSREPRVSSFPSRRPSVMGRDLARSWTLARGGGHPATSCDDRRGTRARFPAGAGVSSSAGQCTRQPWECAEPVSPSPRRRSKFTVGRWRSWKSWRPSIPVPDYRSLVGDGLNNMATVLMDRGNWEEARQLLEQAIVHQKAALEINPQQITYQQSLSAHLTNLTAVQLALGDPAAAARTAEAYAHHVNTHASRRRTSISRHAERRERVAVRDPGRDGGRDAAARFACSTAYGSSDWQLMFC